MTQYHRDIMESTDVPLVIVFQSHFYLLGVNGVMEWLDNRKKSLRE